MLNVLRWSTDAGRLRVGKYEPGRLQPFAPFMGEPVPVVSKAELRTDRRSPRLTCAAAACSAGERHRAWRSSSASCCARGEPFVYAYYDGIDKIAHERGFGPFYDAELRSADDVVEQVRAQLTDDAALLVTADHGQVDVGDRHQGPRCRCAPS